MSGLFIEDKKFLVCALGRWRARTLENWADPRIHITHQGQKSPRDASMVNLSFMHNPQPKNYIRHVTHLPSRVDRGSDSVCVCEKGKRKKSVRTGAEFFSFFFSFYQPDHLQKMWDLECYLFMRASLKRFRNTHGHGGGLNRGHLHASWYVHFIFLTIISSYSHE